MEILHEFRSKSIFIQRMKKLLSSLSLFLLFSANSLTQPSWIPGTPLVSYVGPISVSVDFGINEAGTVYIVVWNYSVGCFTIRCY